MRGLTLVCLWAGVFVAAALYFDWLNQFHLIVGIVLMVLPGALATWVTWRQKGDMSMPDEDLTPHPVRTLLVHVTLAVLCIGYLATSFQLLHGAGFGISHLDHDRGTIEEKAQFLEEAHQFDRVADLLQDRLSQPISDTWARALAERLYRNLLNAGQECKEIGDRRKRFGKALEVARDFQFDDAFARRLDEESLRDHQFLERLSMLRSRKDWRSLELLLEGGLADDAPSRRHLALSTWLKDALLNRAAELKNADEKKQKLERALEVCHAYGLDDHSIKLAVELLDKELRDGQRPAPLPPGATGGIVRVAAEYYPPAVIADVWVDQPDGRPVEKLREKDFQVFWGGKAIRDFVLHEERRDVVPMQFIVAVDTSGSMAGPAIVAAQEGAEALLRGLHPLSKHHGNMWVEVLTFHHEVSVRHPWTKNMLLASSTLRGLKADGGTALYKTIERSVEEFRGRPGHKHLLLFTDGKDMQGGIDLATVLDMCKSEKVTISAIGLRTAELDATTLRRLTHETGGTYLEAQSSDHLLEQFRQAGAQMRPHFYRLVFLPKGMTPGLLEVRIGGDNSLLLKETKQR